MAIPAAFRFSVCYHAWCDFLRGGNSFVTGAVGFVVVFLEALVVLAGLGFVDLRDLGSFGRTVLLRGAPCTVTALAAPARPVLAETAPALLAAAATVPAAILVASVLAWVVFCS